MAGQTDTAVVILSYNSRRWHELFLPLIVAESRDQYDVYLVDHASPDDTADYVRQNFPEIHLIRFHENHGFAWGYAQALKLIEARYFVLLSADFEVSHGWFQPLYACMEQRPDIAACQPKIRYYRDKSYFEYAGAAGGYMDALGYLFCRGRVFDTLEKDTGQYDDIREIFWASGGCCMLRADAYREVGGLDPDLFAHMEEVDLCWRLKRAGYAVTCVGNSTVYHVGGSVISYGSPEKTYYNFRNNLILLLKNEQATRLWWLLPLRFVLDGVAAVQLLGKGQFRNVRAIVRAHWHFFGGYHRWKRKRAAFAPDPKRFNRAGIYAGSIVYQYFLKGKKHFSDLLP